MYYATGLTGWQRAGGYPPPAVPVAAAPLSSDQELDLLKRQAEQVASTLENIQQRIDELQAPTDD